MVYAHENRHSKITPYGEDGEGTRQAGALPTGFTARLFKAQSQWRPSSLCPPWLIFILDGSAHQEKNDGVTKLNKVFPKNGNVQCSSPACGTEELSPALQRWVK